MHHAVHALELADVSSNNVCWNNTADELNHAVCNATGERGAG